MSETILKDDETRYLNSYKGVTLGSPSYLYVISANLEDVEEKIYNVIQFGITNHIENRLNTHRSSGFVSPPISLYSFATRDEARKTEVSIMRLMCSLNIPTATQKGIYFNGSSESFLLKDATPEFLREFRILCKEEGLNSKVII